MSTQQNPVAIGLALLDSIASADEREKLQKLRANPLVQSVHAEYEKQRFENQLAVAAKLKALPAQWKPALDQRIKTKAAAQKRFDAAQHEFEAARQALTEAQVAATGLDIRYQAELAQLTHELEALAPPIFDVFIARGRDAFHALRHVGFAVSFKVGSTYAGNPIMETASNYADVSAAMAGVAELIGEAQALKHKPLSHDQASEALKDLVLAFQAILTPFDLSIMRFGEFGELIVDEFATTRDLTDRATAASRRGADAGEAA